MDELRERVAAAAGEASAARTGIASLAEQVEQLAALRPRVDEIAGSLAVQDALDELRHALEELSERVSAGASRQEHDTQITTRLPRRRAGRAGRDLDMHQRAVRRPAAGILDSLRAEIGSLASGRSSTPTRSKPSHCAREARSDPLWKRSSARSLNSAGASTVGWTARCRHGRSGRRRRDARLSAIADRVGAAAEAEAVEERLAEPERRPADLTRSTRSVPTDRLAESASGERAFLSALHARVDEIVAAVPARTTKPLRPARGARRATGRRRRVARARRLVDRVERTGRCRRGIASCTTPSPARDHARRGSERRRHVSGVEAALAALDGVGNADPRESVAVARPSSSTGWRTPIAASTR
jgi:hypothetical protein